MGDATSLPADSPLALSMKFEDVGITQDQFNVGQQLLSLGIVLLEIPSNMLLYKLGPGKWMSTQVMAFGVISTFQAFQSNYAGFLVTRLLLGCSESGFIPAGLFTMSTWCARLLLHVCFLTLS